MKLEGQIKQGLADHSLDFKCKGKLLKGIEVVT